MSARYNLIAPGNAGPDLQAIITDLNAILARVQGDMKPPRLAKANLPTDDSIRLAIVTDEAGGTTLAFWNGSAWKRVQDLATVS